MASPFLADSNIEQFGYTQELRRTLRLPDLMFYGMVFMVPIAPFAIFGNVFQVSGGMVALAYLAGMLAMMITAASYFQMVKAFPMSGSVYTYAGRGIAPSVGFMAGWAILLDYILAPCLLYVVAAVSLHSLWPVVPAWLYLAAFIVVNTIINFYGIRLTAGFIKAFLIAELAVLGLFLAYGGYALAQGKGRGFSLDPLFNSQTFEWGVVFAAVSIAVLSFLGFDGISMLAEETRTPAKHIGRAMALALLLAGLLFIAQSWVASLLVADPEGLLANGDPNGSAFYDTAFLIGGQGLKLLTAIATAIAWGIADALVAQVATSRLLYAMARDRQMPSFLARVSARRGVPTNSVILVGLISLGLGLYIATRDDGIGLLAGLVNFGAVIAFLTLHLSVVWHYIVRERSRRYVMHLILPMLGFGILVGVVWNAKLLAQQIGFIWLLAGLVVLLTLWVFGRRPSLGMLAYAGGHR